MYRANFFARHIYHPRASIRKKKIKKIILEFFLEFFKVKILMAIVIHQFLYENNVTFQRFRAQIKAKGEFYKIHKTKKKLRRLGT